MWWARLLAIRPVTFSSERILSTSFLFSPFLLHGGFAGRLRRGLAGTKLAQPLARKMQLVVLGSPESHPGLEKRLKDTGFLPVTTASSRTAATSAASACRLSDPAYGPRLQP
jgi:hypothetical protein